MKTFPHSKDTISSHIQRTSSYQTISIRLSYRKIPTSGLPIEISHKYLNILLLSNITTLEQITLPDKTTIMQGLYFQKFYKKSTSTIKKILKIVAEMFSINYTNTCRFSCNTHPHIHTLTP
jgi:hypothetical protein